ncbi:MAG: hypothetical protein UY04_C0015G0021 [Parcubacteria group bacterium GW2011_GWA2_47_7]|nr:MAG: hypothetical protein UY04_C0015G0021 [Parcubacteria group bacterium GW2011_GWA2_47_7]
MTENEVLQYATKNVGLRKAFSWGRRATNIFLLFRKCFLILKEKQILPPCSMQKVFLDDTGVLRECVPP